MTHTPLREATDEMLRQAIGRYAVDLARETWGSARYKATRVWERAIQSELRRRDRQMWSGYAQFTEWRLGDPGDERE